MTNYLPLVFALFFTFQGLKAQHFDRIEERAGIDLSSTNGIAVADYDNDNDLDIFIVARQDEVSNNDGFSRLYRNENNGLFQDVTAESGIVSAFDYSEVDITFPDGHKMSASWGDYDNDGNADLLLANLYYIQLYHNNGDGTFSDATESSNLPEESNCNFVGSTWFDYNKDGFLDVFLVEWGSCDSNLLFKNNGNGTFTDVSSSTGINGNQANSYCALPIDVNDDGWLDIYVSNDFGIPNELFVSNGGTDFTERASESGIDGENDSMGLAVSDYNNDGSVEIYVTNISNNSFYEKSGELNFNNISQDLGIIRAGWAWGAQFGDYDHDMDEDLFVTNGYDSRQKNFFFENTWDKGENKFNNISEDVGLSEFSENRATVMFDYDNDGDLDIILSDIQERVKFYENSTSENSQGNDKNWLKVALEGSSSNKDGLGSTIVLQTSSGETLTRYYSGVNFFSQSLQPVHFGLGSATIESLTIKWPLGTEETYTGLEVNSTIKAIEGEGFSILDLQSNKISGCTDPLSCNFNPSASFDDGMCSYLETKQITGPETTSILAEATYSYPLTQGSSYEWNVTNGEIISGQGTASIQVKWHISSEGSLKVIETNTCSSQPAEKQVSLSYQPDTANHSVARLWNEMLLSAIRNDFARPTVHARNLFHTSVAMYDAWAAFDEMAETYLLGKRLFRYTNQFDGFSTEANKDEACNRALSYACYRLLSHRFFDSPGIDKTMTSMNALMQLLDYDTSFISTDYSSGNPAALGNYIAESIIEYGKTDQSREISRYDNAHYAPTNLPLVPDLPGNPDITDPNKWQPLQLEVFIDQSGNVIDGTTPEFLSPEWGLVDPFSLRDGQLETKFKNGETFKIYLDPGNPPYLNSQGTGTSDIYKWNFSLVSIWGSHLDPSDGVMWDISPSKIGNIDIEQLPNDLADHSQFYNLIEGGDIGKGWDMNPRTNQPYSAQIVPRGDYARVLAEFWADGPDSETPPGHWFTILNYVNDHPLLIKKLNGKGSELEDLEWDVKTYFAMGGAMHDAAIAAWSIKGWHDYIRPISAIRYMASKGQSSNPDLPNYNAEGIPLRDGFIELVKEGDPLAIREEENLNKIKLYTWRGPDFIGNEDTDKAGVGWILAENWWPYQRPSFVTPPFAGYVSGHSTYSRAAAEMLTLFTGDPFFPGGVGEFIAKKNEFLVFEEGPSQDIQLQWATYRDASDQCSLSRIWGGIHPPADDLSGRKIGEVIGKQAFEHALSYFSNLNTSTYLNDHDKDAVIYPNPLESNILTISNTTVDQIFRLYDLRGRTLPIKKSIFNKTSKQTQLDTGDIQSGVYILKSQKQSWKLYIK